MREDHPTPQRQSGREDSLPPLRPEARVTEARWRELLAATRRISASLEPSVVLATAALEAMRLVHGTAALVLRRDEGTLRVAATENLPLQALAPRIAIGPDLTARVRALGAHAGLDGCVGVPLVVREELAGFLAVFAAHGGLFADPAKDVLGALAAQTAVSFDNACVHQATLRRAAAMTDSEEEQLRQTQERYELALAGADLGSWDWNILTGEVTFNTRWAEMRGFRLDELRPDVETWAANVHPDDMPIVQRALEDHFAGRTPVYEAEHRVRCKSGDWMWILDRGRVFTHAPDGRPLRMVGTELDITERKRAEQERARAMERLQTLIDLAPVGIGITIGGCGWRANERAQQLMGIRFDETTDPSKYASGILDAGGRPIPYDQLPGMRALRGERLEGVELILLRPDGRRIPVLCNAAPLRNREDESPAAVVAFEDISPVKELERLRTEWSSIVAHDLRQPINTISLAAGLLPELRGTPATHDQFVEQIRTSARRLGRMIQDLLDFSLLEARQLRLRRSVCELASLTESVAARLRLEEPRRPIHVVVRAPAARVAVDVDPDRFAQILENLLTNALKYGAPDTPIHVVVAAEGSAASVSVINRGPGIAPEHSGHLFERFRTLEDTRRVVGGKSLGLGLYITRELVEAHGGRITFESVPGQVTSFTFALPIVAALARDALAGASVRDAVTT